MPMFLCDVLNSLTYVTDSSLKFKLTLALVAIPLANESFFIGKMNTLLFILFKVT